MLIIIFISALLPLFGEARSGSIKNREDRENRQISERKAAAAGGCRIALVSLYIFLLFSIDFDSIRLA